MTAIAGVVKDGVVWIGGDSAGSDGWNVAVRADQKVFRNGEFVMGFTTSFRMGQLLHHAFSAPDRVEGETTEHYMATTFVDAIRKCLKAGGFATTSDGKETGGTFLVGYRGHLYVVGADYQVGEIVDGYAAVGSGESVLVGALYAAQELDPETRIRLALAAAEHHTAFVRGPFHVERLDAVSQESPK